MRINNGGKKTAYSTIPLQNIHILIQKLWHAISIGPHPNSPLMKRFKSISSNDIYVEVVGSLLNMVNNRKIGIESPVCSTNRPWNPWWSSQALSINWAMHCNLLPPKVIFRHKKSWVLKMKCMIDLLVDKQII